MPTFKLANTCSRGWTYNVRFGPNGNPYIAMRGKPHLIHSIPAAMAAPYFPASFKRELSAVLEAR